MSNQLRINELFQSFPGATRNDWEKAAVSESNGQELTWKGPENLRFLPYYDLETVGAISFEPHSFAVNSKHIDARHWVNQPPVIIQNETSANKNATNHLKNGAKGLFLIVTEQSNLTFGQLLSDEDLTSVRLSFCLPHANGSLAPLAQYTQHHNVYGNVFFKTFPGNPDVVLNEFSGAKNLSALGIYIEADPNPLVEMQKALLQGVTVLDQLTDRGYSPSSVIRQIAFSLEAGSNFFYTVAKFRALRLLWNNVVNAYGVSDFHTGDVHLHARSEAFTGEAFQPNGNMLKGTTASIAAIAGGCDALTVYPEDDKNETMSRIARNVSTILREESHLQRVADPLAGSYFIEKLTDDFAVKAWENFQKEINVLK